MVMSCIFILFVMKGRMTYCDMMLRRPNKPTYAPNTMLPQLNFRRKYRYMVGPLPVIRNISSRKQQASHYIVI